MADAGPDEQGLASSIDRAPGFGNTIAEAISPGTPETGLGRVAKHFGAEVGNFLPYALAGRFIPGAGSGLLGGVEALGSGEVIKGLSGILGSNIPAAAAFGPELVQGIYQGGKQAVQDVGQGEYGKAAEHGSEALLMAGLGALMAHGSIHEIQAMKALRASRGQKITPDVPVDPRVAQTTTTGIPGEAPIIPDEGANPLGTGGTNSYTPPPFTPRPPDPSLSPRTGSDITPPPNIPPPEGGWGASGKPTGSFNPPPMDLPPAPPPDPSLSPVTTTGTGSAPVNPAGQWGLSPSSGSGGTFSLPGKVEPPPRPETILALPPATTDVTPPSTPSRPKIPGQIQGTWMDKGETPPIVDPVPPPVVPEVPPEVTPPVDSNNKPGGKYTPEIREQILKEITNTTFRATGEGSIPFLAKKYKVAQNTIRKWHAEAKAAEAGEAPTEHVDQADVPIYTPLEALQQEHIQKLIPEVTAEVIKEKGAVKGAAFARNHPDVIRKLAEKEYFVRANHMTGVPGIGAFDDAVAKLESNPSDPTGKIKKAAFLSGDARKFHDWNKLYGHENGDLALKAVGQLWAKASADVTGTQVFQPSGDELRAIASTLEQAHQLGQRLQELAKTATVEIIDANGNRRHVGLPELDYGAAEGEFRHADAELQKVKDSRGTPGVSDRRGDDGGGENYYQNKNAGDGGTPPYSRRATDSAYTGKETVPNGSVEKLGNGDKGGGDEGGGTPGSSNGGISDVGNKLGNDVGTPPGSKATELNTGGSEGGQGGNGTTSGNEGQRLTEGGVGDEHGTDVPPGSITGQEGSEGSGLAPTPPGSSPGVPTKPPRRPRKGQSKPAPTPPGIPTREPGKIPLNPSLIDKQLELIGGGENADNPLISDKVANQIFPPEVSVVPPLGGKGKQVAPDGLPIFTDKRSIRIVKESTGPGGLDMSAQHPIQRFEIENMGDRSAYDRPGASLLGYIDSVNDGSAMKEVERLIKKGLLPPDAAVRLTEEERFEAGNKNAIDIEAKPVVDAPLQLEAAKPSPSLESQFKEKTAGTLKEDPLSFLQRAGQEAKDRLNARKSPMNELGSAYWETAKTFKDGVVYLSSLIDKGVRDFASASKRMISEFGEGITPHLKRLWARAQEHWETFKAKKDEAFGPSEAGALALGKEGLKGIKPIPLPKKASINETSPTYKTLKEEFPRITDKNSSLLLRLHKEGSPTEYREALKKAGNPHWADMLAEGYKAGLVSGPPSAIANIASNTLLRGLTDWEHTLSVGLDAVRSKVTGAKRERFSEEIPARFAAYRAALSGPDGAIANLARNHLGFTLEPLQNKFGGRVQDTPVNAIPGSVGEAIRIPFKVMDAFDSMAKHMSGFGEAASIAIRRTKAKGLKGEAFKNEFGKLLKEMQDVASNGPESKHYGKYKEEFEQIQKAYLEDTFQTTLGPIGQAVKGLAASHPLIGSALLPFITVPANVAKATLKRTPLAFLHGEVSIPNLIKKAKNGTLSGKDMDALAKPLTGSMIALGMGMAAAEGVITGGGPSDPKLKSALEESGWQPYSIKIGTNYVSYQRFEPISSIIGMAADVVEGKRSGAFSNPHDAVEKIAGSIGENLTSKTFLAGLEGFATAWHDPVRYGGRWIRQLEASLVPNIVSKTAQAIDPVYRETSEGVLDPITARLPGLSKILPAQTSPSGEVRERKGTAIERLASPLPRSEEKGQEGDLGREFADIGWAPSRPKRAIYIEGRKVSLTQEEISKLEKAQVQASKAAMAVLSDPTYKRLPKNEEDPSFTPGRKTRSDVLENLYRRQRRIVLAEVTREAAKRSRSSPTP